MIYYSWRCVYECSSDSCLSGRGTRSFIAANEAISTRCYIDNLQILIEQLSSDAEGFEAKRTDLLRAKVSDNARTFQNDTLAFYLEFKMLKLTLYVIFDVSDSLGILNGVSENNRI